MPDGSIILVEIARSTLSPVTDGEIEVLADLGGGPNGAACTLPDRVTTNICFGGDNLQTAFVTLSSTGKLVSLPWEVPGLPLNFLNQP